MKEISWGQRCAPAGVPHDPVHQVEVHEPEASDWGLKVEVYHIVLAHAPQVLGMAHPGQGIDHLVVPGQLVEKSAP